MDLQAIEKLLDKYYLGETSLNEERELKEFFAKNEVPDHLIPDQQQFSYYSDSLKEKLEDDDFESNLLAKISGADKGKVVPLKRYYRTISGIAASILLLISAYLYMYSDLIFKDDAYKTSSYENPELAYAETKKALLLISEKLNKGTGKLSELSKFNQAKNLITNKNK